MEAPSISTNVQYPSVQPRRDVLLPHIERAPRHEPPLLDRIGDQVRDRRWLPGAGAAVGAVAAGALAVRGGHGLPFRIASSISGAVVGAALALGVGSGIDAPRSTDPVSGGAEVASPEVVADEDLRVMTFNVHGGMGPEGAQGASSAEFDRIARAIEAEDPDVVLLQEVDRFAIRSNRRDTLDELTARLQPDGAAFTPRGTMVTGRQEGTGILTFNGTHIADARGLISDDPYGSGVSRRVSAGITGGLRGIEKAVTKAEQEKLREEHEKLKEEPVEVEQPEDEGLLLRGGMRIIDGIRTIRDALPEKDADRTGENPGNDPTADAPTPDYFPRVTTDAMLVTPKGNHVRVLGGHYNGPTDVTDYQSIQVAPVAGMVDGWRGPTLWAADWNVTSASARGQHEAQMLGDAGLRDTFTEAGVKPGDKSRRSYGHQARSDIDRIYMSDQFTISDVSDELDTSPVRVVPFDAAEPDASDHRPVVADLHLQAPDPDAVDDR